MLKNAVIFTEQEYHDFRILLAERLFNRWERPTGYTIISRTSGAAVDRLEDWLIGNIVTACSEVEEILAERSAGKAP